MRASDLILASGSPRRADLLTQLGLRFQVRTAHVDESIDSSEGPGQAARRLAALKAMTVAEQLHEEDPTNDPRWVIGADTLGYLDGRFLTKPKDEADAEQMLSFMEGRTHRVVSGVCVICIEPGRRLIKRRREGATTHEVDGALLHEWTGFEETNVRFAHLPKRTIKAYVRSGEPMGKAGGYAIQGMADPFVLGIDGSYSNVVGLPTHTAMRLLEQAGYKLPIRLRVQVKSELKAGSVLP